MFLAMGWGCDATLQIGNGALRVRALPRLGGQLADRGPALQVCALATAPLLGHTRRTHLI